MNAQLVALPLSPEEIDWCRWRAWAADVRDRKDQHARVTPDLCEKAALLARTLDLWQQQYHRERQATNLLQPLEGAVEALTGWLLLKGVRPPALQPATARHS